MIKLLVHLLNVYLLAAAQANCLVESEITIGTGQGKAFSNMVELRDFNFESLTLFEIKTCLINEELTGLQFTLEDTETGQFFTLSQMGTTNPNCQLLTLDDGIDQIWASYNKDRDSISSISYFNNDKVKTYGV